MLNEHVKYDRHKEEFDACINDPERRKVALTWLQQSNTLDCWRHNRMYSLMKPIIEWNRNASWLTIGDGRFGTDANALIKNGANNVHCSDMSDTLLKVGNEEGFINSYSAENAEALNFSDNSFDFVYCKEAFHHFPRPYIALNEMFRVARSAVILMEPRDGNIEQAFLYPLLNILRKILGRRSSKHDFESVGNYIYALSEHEMEKFLLGMHFRYIAFKGINDSYKAGIEFIELEATNLKEKKIIRSIKNKIHFLDILEKLGFRKSSLLSVILFKQKPIDAQADSLISCGWNVKELPKNPYLK